MWSCGHGVVDLLVEYGLFGSFDTVYWVGLDGRPFALFGIYMEVGHWRLDITDFGNRLRSCCITLYLVCLVSAAVCLW